MRNMFDRRDFLKQAGSLLVLPSAAVASNERRCDVAVVGGGLGGVAAALATLRNGQRVVLTVGTTDGLAKVPYIRESRRIQAEFTVLEQHVGTEARGLAVQAAPEQLTAEVFRDSVGVGSYRIDLHMSTGGDNYIDVSSLPFQIPLGALIPRRVENLIPACKNLGVTHITNGCYRLHPVEWNIGEAAGCLAARAIQIKSVPRRIRSDAKLLADFQAALQRQGVEITWPRLTPR